MHPQQCFYTTADQLLRDQLPVFHAQPSARNTLQSE
jgi:hypothetical protein